MKDIEVIGRSPRFSLRESAANVTYRPDHASAVHAVLDKRHSLEPSAPTDVVSARTLLDVAAAAYGRTSLGTKTVPSAGRLWPLHLHLLSRKDPSTYDSFWFDDEQGCLRLKGTLPAPSVEGAFIRDDILLRHLRSGAGLICICADLRRISAKYGSRAYRYVLLEAGAAMQNAYLLAAERNLGVRAYGGFLDGALAEHLRLPAESIPAICLLIARNPR